MSKQTIKKLIKASNAFTTSKKLLPQSGSSQQV